VEGTSRAKDFSPKPFINRWHCGFDGDLTEAGRVKNIVIRLCENISPRKVEEILIHEIAVAGIPGECARAVIVPVSPQALTVSSIRDFLEVRGVARFKIAEQVILQDILLRNDAGEVLKDRIRASIISQGREV
jgi:acyl-CoA synthetase (AMP-forming)/AMP-acid ligase II